MSQLRFNRLRSFLTPGSIIEVQKLDGESPVNYSWSRAKVILMPEHSVSSYTGTELIYTLKVKELSKLIQSTSNEEISVVNLERCRPVQPSEKKDFTKGEMVQVLMEDTWVEASVTETSGKGKAKNYNVYVPSCGLTITVKKSELRSRKIWDRNSNWVEE